MQPATRNCFLRLAEDFVQHDYDLRRLIRGIVLSRTYSRSSRWQLRIASSGCSDICRGRHTATHTPSTGSVAPNCRSQQQLMADR
ncbi:MAG UNVERIFIED_CONTAM: DUF1553 domain-containing protein [Planctomycetaceae bacterium]